MSEQRFDRLEKMMEQLIQMVGHNNAVTEELRQEVKEIKSDIAHLDTKIERYGEVQQQDIYHLLKMMDKKLDQSATKDDIDRLALDVAFLVRKAAEHESDIRELRRAK